MNSREYQEIQKAYFEVYEIDEAREDEGLSPLQKVRKRNKAYALPGEPAGQQTSNRRQGHKSIRGVKQDKGAKSAFGTMRYVGGPYNEEVDLYDAILSHLLDEGYADTLEAAEGIMVSMSEEWREEIVEAAADQSDKQIEKGVKTTYKAQNVLDNQHQGRSKGLNKLPRGEREEKAKRMSGRLKTRRDDLFKERNKREDESRAEFKKKYGF